MQMLIEKAPLLVSITLAVGITAGAGYQGHGLWQSLQAPPPSQSSGTEASRSAPAPSPADELNLAELRVFGVPGETSEPEVVQTEDLPETNLRLTLRGVMAGDSEQRGSALVEGPDRKTEVYVLGDTLPGNARLHSVYARRVVLDRGGQLENLYFPEERSAGVATVAQRSTGRSAQQPRRVEPIQQQDPVRSLDDQQQQEEVRARLDELRRRLRAN